MSLEEWRQAIIAPPAYRFGNSSFRFQTKFVVLILIITVVGILYIALPQSTAAAGSNYDSTDPYSLEVGGKKASLLAKYGKVYNDTYPISSAVSTEKGLRRRVGIIADLDQDSKTTWNKWMSYLRRGYLFIQYNAASPKLSKVSIEWDSGEPLVLKSGLSLDGRGMELSELVVFNGKVYTCDDRTGVIYELPNVAESSASGSSDLNFQPVPWVILADGNGTVPKGFKCEWGCVKDGHLWIGGLGKEWTTPAGELVNFDPQFVKRISPTGEVTHLDWRSRYQRMSSDMGIHFPGYVVHESGGWSERLKQWMFLPRRASKETYNDKTDEKMGTNVMLLANEDFSKIDVRTVGEVVPTHGFSTFKWIPGTNDQLVVALKSEEIEGKTASYILVFDIDGNIVLPETKVGDHKYEGIEFL